MPTLTEATLQRSIAIGETTTVELKKAVPRPGELASQRRLPAATWRRS
jgi:hypothetical protein